MIEKKIIAAVVLLFIVVLSFVGFVLRADWIARKLQAVQPIASTQSILSSCSTRSELAELVLVGDSRITQWPQSLFGLRSVLKLGVVGETVVQMTERIKKNIIPCHYKSVLISSGINDLVAASLAGKKVGHDIAVDTAERLIGLANIVARSGTRVCLSTIIPPARPNIWRQLVWGNKIYEYVGQVNAVLRQRLVGSEMVLLDFAAELDPQSSGVLANEYRRDTLHLNVAAYAALTKVALISCPDP